MLRSGTRVLGVVLLLSACGVDSEEAGTGSSADTNVPSDAVAPDAVASDDVTTPGDDTSEPKEETTTPDASLRIRSEPEDDVAFIYDPSELRTFEILLSEDNLAFLDADPAAEIYVPGTLVFEGVEYDNVGIRYKGSVGAWIFCTANSTPASPFNIGGAKTCPKLSLKVSFNKYDPEGRFFGVKKLLFHSMNQDRSMMRERLGYGLFRAMGIAAPRVVHVRLLINGELVGVFANVEYIDGRFTRSRFEDGEGNLYKEVWPTWNPLSSEVTEERLLAGLKTNEDENPSVDKVLQFSEAMQGDEEARAQTVQDWMSVEYTQRFIAVDRTIGADDGPFHFYCSEAACDNHNFYVYEEEHADRIWLIPWDLDHAFVVFGGGIGADADAFLKVVDDWDDATVPCEAHQGATIYSPWQMPPACDPLFKTCGSSFKGAVDDAVEEFLAGPFSESVVDEQLATWTAQITDAVAEIHQVDSRQATPDDWQAGVEDLRNRIDYLRAQAGAGAHQGLPLP